MNKMTETAQRRSLSVLSKSDLISSDFQVLKTNGVTASLVLFSPELALIASNFLVPSNIWLIRGVLRVGMSKPWAR